MNDLALHEHLIGRQGGRADLNTPSLVVDLDVLDRNIARMSAFAAEAGVALRPHAKTHKCAQIALRQIEKGALGVCCAKIGEAEALAREGVGGILLTSPVVGPAAIARLVRLVAALEELIVVVDHPENVLALAQAASASNVCLNVLIDIDPGFRRTGVASAAAAVALLDAIKLQPSLAYRGVQFYCGAEQHIADAQERWSAITSRTDYLRSALDALKAAGGEPLIISGGGTGSHEIDAALGVFTELQVGSYVFMDADYLACSPVSDAGWGYEPSLFVDARVVSANAEGMVTIDAGLKAFASEAGPPAIIAGAADGAVYQFMGDEHGAVVMPALATKPGLGQVIRLVPPHCDPTVNLYDTFHVVRGETLVALWPIEGRGRSR